MRFFGKVLMVAVCAASLAACGGAEKAGGQKGSAAAQNGQKSGSSAKGDRDSGSSQGNTHDGVVCDGANEGVGWCASDEEIVFCGDGEWWLLDCAEIEDGGYCGYDEELEEVDCYVE